MTVLTTTRVANGRATPAASPQPVPPQPVPPASSGMLPIVIDPPRGGVYEGERRRFGGVVAPAPAARDTVLAAIWPLVGACSASAPGPDVIGTSDTAAARVRALVANEVARFRVRIGTAARDVGTERVAVEDWALALRIDQAGLLDRMLAQLSPTDLAAAAVGGRHPAAHAVERTVASRVELHLSGLVQSEPRLSETTRARLLLSLTASGD